MDSQGLERLRAQLRRHEGCKKNARGRHVVYNDSLGIATAGYGRNMRDTGLSEIEANYLLENDIIEREMGLQQSLPYYAELDGVRQRVLINMAFMGLPKLLKFEDMLRALAAKNYEKAAAEMLNSKWARQVGDRATELAKMMRTGMDVA